MILDRNDSGMGGVIENDSNIHWWSNGVGSLGQEGSRTNWWTL